MRSTSCSEIAEGLLDRSIAGRPPEDLPLALLDESCGSALFGILVEGLADRFEPSLCDTYAHLFSQAIAHAVPGADAPELVARYQRVRRVRPVAWEPRDVFVLSRVTLGADVAVTSVLLAAAKQRFPQARISFIAPHKNLELFAGDPRIHPVPIAYHRGGLRDRLAVWDELRTLVAAPDSIVLDPDSRLTQLGLLPICPEDRYHFFESRAYGADSTSTLAELATAWASETLGVKGARPYLALETSRAPSAWAGESACPTIAPALPSSSDLVGQALPPAHLSLTAAPAAPTSSSDPVGQALPPAHLSLTATPAAPTSSSDPVGQALPPAHLSLTATPAAPTSYSDPVGQALPPAHPSLSATPAAPTSSSDPVGQALPPAHPSLSAAPAAPTSPSDPGPESSDQTRLRGEPTAYIAINLGVGENPAKRLPDPFEQDLLSLLAETGLALYIDKGAGGEEAERVLRAVERSGVRPTFWEGSLAGFAQIIAGSQLYVGYDSAGQHVAAASGVPLITIFAGFPVPRMFDRWRPYGPHCRVIRVDRPDPAETLTKVKFALQVLRS